MLVSWMYRNKGVNEICDRDTKSIEITTNEVI